MLEEKLLERKSSCVPFNWERKLPADPKLTLALNRPLGRALGSWLWLQRTKNSVRREAPGSPAVPPETMLDRDKEKLPLKR